MISLDVSASPASAHTLRLSRRIAPALYSATLFVSALLLFTVQPMFTKMVLPRLGGSPSVWSVAMVAFQTFLFAGYAYAHLVARLLRPAQAAALHLAFLSLVALTLPLGIASGFTVPPADSVMLWLIELFAFSIGIPFIALSATAPLLQHWFVATGHPQAKNPYVLYAASNLGSFCGLLAYPFAIEPFFTLRMQTLLWSLGFSLLALCIGAAAYLAANGAIVISTPAEGAHPRWQQRAAWPLLTAVPAGLCIAVTSFIATDVAAAPFLWMVPLALYLLTFVAVFRDRPWVSHSLVLRLLPYVLTPLAISVFGNGKTYWFAVILLNLTAFTVISLACHGEAYRLRPGTSRLTEFYLWTSFGGMLGGVFAGIVAPHLFNYTYEYPVLIVAALLVLPGLFSGGARYFFRESAPGLIATAGALAVWLIISARLPLSAELPMQVALVALSALMLFNAKHPARFAGLVVFAFVLTGLWRPGLGHVEKFRSFFGVHQVVDTADGNYRLLFNGTTIHGAERIRAEAGQLLPARPEPLTYYYFGGPLSDTIEAARGAQHHLDQVAVVGLGTGSLACHRRDGEHWTFFEIDPEVVRIARDPHYFNFLSACAPHERIVLGDARLTLAASSEQYDLIVLDAFSSDAIPVHLLTREALRSYMERLTPHGIMAIHVSNRHMELASVVAAFGKVEGLTTYDKQDNQAADFIKDYRANAEVVVLARNSADLDALPSWRGWRKLEPTPGVAEWTDDYSDILHAMLRKSFGD
ncbi:MAG: fused MFS/spermidine synthase [Xanthobacteraceae bacterium]